MSTTATTHSTEPGALRWYRWLVWAGIASNLAVSIVSIIYPAEVLAFVGVDPATPLIWPRLAVMLLALLSIFYIPAALDPCAHRFSAIFAVVCRFAGTIFFAIIGGRYIPFSLFDFVFGAPQAICLYLGWQRMKAGAGVSAGRPVAVLASLLAVAFFLWSSFQWFMAPVVPTFASDEEHFKYGSIGNDGASGVPYPIWVAMPAVCAHQLPRPQGYAAFGLLYEPGRNPAVDPPVGLSRAKVGVERMSINCAVCHTVRARLAPDAEPRLYIGAAANTLDIQGYQRFLSRCAADDRFTADNLIPAMADKVKLSWLDDSFTALSSSRSCASGCWSNGTLSPGRTTARPGGRVGSIRSIRSNSECYALPMTGPSVTATCRRYGILNARERIRSPSPFHWDGLNDSLREVVISSALGDGAVAKEFSYPAMERIERFLRTMPAPPSPHRPDAAAVERGKAVFAANCGECHASGGKRTLTVIPVAEVGTDVHRSQMWTEAARDAYNNYREGRDWGFKSFHKNTGYVAEPLDGLWLNGPYLHNGSVPSLRDLLELPPQRPATFVRGLDVVDGRNGGFIAPSCDPRQDPAEGFCFDTRLVGNGNGGHVYGTSLSATEKSDLLAYLLTF